MTEVCQKPYCENLVFPQNFYCSECDIASDEAANGPGVPLDLKKVVYDLAREVDALRNLVLDE